MTGSQAAPAEHSPQPATYTGIWLQWFREVAHFIGLASAIATRWQRYSIRGERRELFEGFKAMKEFRIIWAKRSTPINDARARRYLHPAAVQLIVKSPSVSRIDIQQFILLCGITAKLRAS